MGVMGVVGMIRILLLGMLTLTSCGKCTKSNDPIVRCIGFSHEISECIELARALCCCDKKGQN